MDIPLQGQEADSSILDQCFLCKAWHLEEDLLPIEVPDQVGYVQKLGCENCLDEIYGTLETS